MAEYAPWAVMRHKHCLTSFDVFILDWSEILSRLNYDVDIILTDLNVLWNECWVSACANID